MFAETLESLSRFLGIPERWMHLDQNPLLHAGIRGAIAS
jgi:hypothetical protein